MPREEIDTQHTRTRYAREPLRSTPPHPKNRKKPPRLLQAAVTQIRFSPHRDLRTPNLASRPRQPTNMRKPTQRPTATQDGKSCRHHVRYGVRNGRVPGNYRAWFGLGQAQEQVNGMHACHMGFTQAMVTMNLHHKYLQGHYGPDQIKKLKLGIIPTGETPFSPAPYDYYDVDAPSQSQPTEVGGEQSTEHGPTAP